MNTENKVSNKEQLIKWKQEAEATLKSLKSDQIDEAIDAMHGYTAYDKAKAYEKITGESYNENNDSVFKINWKYVASIAALFVVGLFVLNPFADKPKSTFVSQTFNTSIDAKSITLADLSEVLLDRSSTLVHDADRRVKLNGRAFFKVATTKDKAPFEVVFNDAKVTVLGTQFSVATGDNSAVVVKEGKVKFDFKDQSIILTAGQSAKIVEGHIIKQDMGANSFSWANQTLVFQNTPLPQVLSDLSSHFHTKIGIAPSVSFSSKCVLTSKVQNSTLTQVLQELSVLFNMRYEIKDGNVTITKVSC